MKSLYGLLLASELTRAAVSSLISWYGFGRACMFAVTHSLAELDGENSREVLRALTPMVRLVLIQAYDDEGYVAWVPSADVARTVFGPSLDR